MTRWLFALLAFIPERADAQTLWGNIDSGMTVARIRSLYPPPASRPYLSESTLLRQREQVGPCQADVVIQHPQGRVTAVRVQEPRIWTGLGSRIISRCGEHALQMLVQRYGNPDSISRRVNSMNVSADERTWIRNGISVELLLHADRQRTWTITYRPAAAGQGRHQSTQADRPGPGTPAGGSGLLIATHAPTGTEVRLREVGSSIELVSTSRGGLSVSYDIDIDANGRIDPNVDLSYGWLDNDLACASYRLAANAWTGCAVDRSRGRGRREVTGQGRVSRWSIPISEIAPGGRAFGYRVKFYDPRTRQNIAGPSGVYRLRGGARQNASSAAAPQSLLAAANQSRRTLDDCMRLRWEAGVASATSGNEGGRIAAAVLTACQPQLRAWQAATEAYIASDAVPPAQKQQLRRDIANEAATFGYNLDMAARRAIARRQGGNRAR